MTIQEKLTADLKTALLAGKAEDVSTLRLLQSELKNQRIALGNELDDEQVIQVIRKAVKQRQETAETYTKVGRTDLAEKERSEATLLESYLPAAIDPAELSEFIAAEMAKFSPFEPRNRGDVIRAATAKYGSSVDGKTVSDTISRLIG